MKLIQVISYISVFLSKITNLSMLRFLRKSRENPFLESLSYSRRGSKADFLCILFFACCKKKPFLRVIICGVLESKIATVLRNKRGTVSPEREDYAYDNSKRETQRQQFKRKIESSGSNFRIV